MPGGKFYLFVPAVNVLFSSMDRKVGHLRRYRKSTLILLVKKIGFSVVRCSYVDSLGFLITLMFKIIGNEQGDLNPAIIKFYDRFLFPASRVLDRFCGEFFGKNLEIVMIKK